MYCRRITLFTIVVALIMPLVASNAWGEIALAPVFGDHMVLQRDMPINLWGTGEPGEQVVVQFADISYATVVNPEGTWALQLAKCSASMDPLPLTVKGDDNTIVIEDILVGEVWICSGQSNMAGNVGTRETAATDEFPLIRHYTSSAGGGEWIPTTPDTVKGFTAAGYFFGRTLHQELDVPVGLMKAAVGGTLIQPWTPVGAHPEATGELYERLIAPMVPYTIRGTIWYQGEANTREPALADHYDDMLVALISSWRENWNQGDFPFYYVQLPSIASPDRVYYTVRDRMDQALTRLPAIGMSCNIDIDEGLHPASKHIMGERLALLALRDVYEQKIVAEGPRFESMEIADGTIVCSFTDVGEGLVCQGDAITNFEIAGEDLEFVPAAAKIDGDTVIVSSDAVETPVAVRYAYSNNPKEVTLFNENGLPAAPFQVGVE